MSAYRSFTRKATATVAVVLGLLVAGAGTATAGTNGQQLVLCAPKHGASNTVWHANVTGTNEKGQQINDSPIVRVGNPGACTYYLQRWWWKGHTTLHWWFQLTDGSYEQAPAPDTWTTCEVPTSNKTDWWVCYGRG
ncbi:hypothetical protein [Kutzneria sp. NPDC051319]|uniref:hypothetical protein n=1 Tax=Kutzneria sp. NPDC051319 TaxID=3155047 RepID=UPI00343423BB